MLWGRQGWRGWRDTGNVPGNDHTAYPDSTPRTRLRTKKDPMMMRGMKYSQFQVAPKASLVWRGGEKNTRVTSPSTAVLQADHTRLLGGMWPRLPSLGGHSSPPEEPWHPSAPCTSHTLHSPDHIRQGCSPPPPPTIPAETVRDECGWRCRVLQPKSGVLRARGHPEQFGSGLPCTSTRMGQSSPTAPGPAEHRFIGCLKARGGDI